MLILARRLIQSLVLALSLFSANTTASGLPEQLLTMPITLISGEQTTLANYDGKKPVYLKFWATWCEPCREEMPHFEHVQNEYGALVEVIGINLGINDDINAVEDTIKEFGLTMPMAIDSNGDLAQAFQMVGTPYHLLFDRNMNLIHRGHQANESLDNKLALVSQTQPLDLLDSSVLTKQEVDLKLNLNDGKTHALFFTATWCDWYLKDSRPQVSKNCSQAQKNVTILAQQATQLVWNGVISRLWTGEKDLADYKRKYAINYPIEIDKNNRLFHQYLVKDLPTLIIVKDNEVILTITDFDDEQKVAGLLSGL